ncbi:MAG: rhomboid family intramembrane serine protease [Gemmataceae bacterium]
MGIYDRDYVRREGPSFLGSFTERGRVCLWLIGVNIAFFIVQVLTWPTDPDAIGSGWFTDALALDARDVLHGQIWRLLTYAFLHQPNEIFHILFNMLFLWWFGSDVEDLYGPREFLTFYLSASFVSGLLFVFSSLAWMPDPRPCIGASGGVMAVLTLCAIHYPRRTILLFFILPVPLPLFLLIFLAGDAYAFLSRTPSYTAVAAHLGGALFAGVYYRMNWRLTDWLPRMRSWRQWRRLLFRPRLRVYREEDETRTPVRVQAKPATLDEEQLEEKMDAILAKISRVGKENLTESERAILLRASEIIRRRRT